VLAVPLSGASKTLPRFFARREVEGPPVARRDTPWQTELPGRWPGYPPILGLRAQQGASESMRIDLAQGALLICSVRVHGRATCRELQQPSRHMRGHVI
jgi:hypothetical protein